MREDVAKDIINACGIYMVFVGCFILVSMILPFISFLLIIPNLFGLMRFYHFVPVVALFCVVVGIYLRKNKNWARVLSGILNLLFLIGIIYYIIDLSISWWGIEAGNIAPGFNEVVIPVAISGIVPIILCVLCIYYLFFNKDIREIFDVGKVE